MGNQAHYEVIMKRLFIGLLALLASAAAFAAAPQITVSWTAPTANTDGTAITGAITYQLYVGTSGKEAKFGNPVTSPPYIITPTPAPGSQVCVQVTAIANGVESDRTPEACTVVPFPVPGSPTVVTIVIK